MSRSLTRVDLQGLPDGTPIVVTFAGRPGCRQTIVCELWRDGDELEAWRGPVMVGTLNPGDGVDADFVALAEGAEP